MPIRFQNLANSPHSFLLPDSLSNFLLTSNLPFWDFTNSLVNFFREISHTNNLIKLSFNLLTVMIKIIEHPRGRSTGDEVLIKDNGPFDRHERYSFGERGRACDHFYTRKDEQGPIVTVHLYGEGDGFDLIDGNGRYREANLPTVQTSDDGREWSEDEFAIWLPDRKLWVGIKRRITYERPGTQYPENLTLVAPIEVDTNLASAIYEAVHGKPFAEEMAKLEPPAQQS